jgi:hypothetical protein
VDGGLLIKLKLKSIFSTLKYYASVSLIKYLSAYMTGTVLHDSHMVTGNKLTIPVVW